MPWRSSCDDGFPAGTLPAGVDDGKLHHPRMGEGEETVRSDSMTVASEINERMRMVREFAPNLVCLRAALVPFNDVIVEESAGPQPQADDYDPDEEPHFSVGVKCGQFSNCTVVFHFTADRITVQEWVVIGTGKKREEVPGDDPRPITLDGVFNYLRQLPRPVSSY